jgi:hypothetical protein
VSAPLVLADGQLPRTQQAAGRTTPPLTDGQARQVVTNGVQHGDRAARVADGLLHVVGLQRLLLRWLRCCVAGTSCCLALRVSCGGGHVASARASVRRLRKPHPRHGALLRQVARKCAPRSTQSHTRCTFFVRLVALLGDGEQQQHRQHGLRHHRQQLV